MPHNEDDAIGEPIPACVLSSKGIGDRVHQVPVHAHVPSKPLNVISTNILDEIPEKESLNWLSLPVEYETQNTFYGFKLSQLSRRGLLKVIHSLEGQIEASRAFREALHKL